MSIWKKLFGGSKIRTASASQNEAKFTDARDGKVYKCVKIGTQIWMAENLNYETPDSWGNQRTYGRLYTWEAAKKACPSGWHLPSDEEWTTLVNFLGGEDVAGGKLKSRSGWDNPSDKRNYPDVEITKGTNESGFSGLPGGLINLDKMFSSQGGYAMWWSSSEYDATEAWNYRLYWQNNRSHRCGVGYGYKGFGFSVRGIKDA